MYETYVFSKYFMCLVYHKIEEIVNLLIRFDSQLNITKRIYFLPFPFNEEQLPFIKEKNYPLWSQINEESLPIIKCFG